MKALTATIAALGLLYTHNSLAACPGIAVGKQLPEVSVVADKKPTSLRALAKKSKLTAFVFYRSADW